MALSVERICNELNRKQLLPPLDIRNLRQRWLREAGASAADPVLFVKWKDPALRFPTPGHAAQELRRFLTPK